MKVEFDPIDLTFTITGACKITGIPYQIVVPALGYIEWNQGKLIEYALPNLTAEEQVILLHGVTAQGWALYSLDGLGKKAIDIAKEIQNDPSKYLLSLREVDLIEAGEYLKVAGIMLYNEFERSMRENSKATK